MSCRSRDIDVFYFLCPRRTGFRTGRRGYVLLGCVQVTRPVLVFIDYENMRYTPKHAFGSSPVDFSPTRFSQLVISRRNVLSRIYQVRVYRGMSKLDIHPERAGRDEARVKQWEKDQRVVAVTRSLQYRWVDGRPVGYEKGIDVALAVDLIRFAHSDVEADVVVASRDSDLNPALEAFIEADRLNRRIEVVSSKRLERLRIWNSQKPWCHYLTKEDFDLIRED